MNTLFIRVDYDEFDPASYRGVYVTGPGGEVARFDKDGPARDFIRAVQSTDGALTFVTSSCDHFVMDGGELGPAYEAYDRYRCGGQGATIEPIQ